MRTRRGMKRKTVQNDLNSQTSEMYALYGYGGMLTKLIMAISHNTTNTNIETGYFKTEETMRRPKTYGGNEPGNGES